MVLAPSSHPNSTTLAALRVCKSYLMTSAKVILCVGCGLYANSIPSRPVAGAFVGGFSFLAMEAIADHVHRRKFMQIAAGALLATAGTSVSFTLNQIGFAIVTWGVGLGITHTDRIWNHCYRVEGPQ